MEWTQEKIEEVYLQIQQKAVVDEDFREALLKDTTATIEKFIGEKLPEGFQIKVIENDPAYTATFVLPPMVSDELNDEDLEGVAGGVCGAQVNPCGLEGCLGKIDISPK